MPARARNAVLLGAAIVGMVALVALGSLAGFVSGSVTRPFAWAGDAAAIIGARPPVNCFVDLRAIEMRKGSFEPSRLKVECK